MGASSAACRLLALLCVARCEALPTVIALRSRFEVVLPRWDGGDVVESSGLPEGSGFIISVVRALAAATCCGGLCSWFVPATR